MDFEPQKLTLPECHYRGVTKSKVPGKFRSQISAGGRTISLGDHTSAESAARAYDRACIHRLGAAANTNFPVHQYEAEQRQLTAMTQPEVVAMLRSQARSSAGQTSRYRGVSLLRRTGRWHAQINADSRQVHLGFYPQERQAAEAYDRAALCKWAAGLAAGEWAKVAAACHPAAEAEDLMASAALAGAPPTNMELACYREELPVLRSVGSARLLEALAHEHLRRHVMGLLAHGFTPAATAAVFHPQAAVCVSGGKGQQSAEAAAVPAPSSPMVQHLVRKPSSALASLNAKRVKRRRKAFLPCCAPLV